MKMSEAMILLGYQGLSGGQELIRKQEAREQQAEEVSEEKEAQSATTVSGQKEQK